MAQPYTKQLIFSWLRMVHRKVALLFRVSFTAKITLPKQ